MKKIKNILFISFYFEPYSGVGAKRISYWANNIKNFGYNPFVITAFQQEKERDFPVIYVPYSKQKKGFITKIIKDEGYTWKEEVKKVIEKQQFIHRLDVVVISGGPFFQFELGRYLKQKFNCQIILDFRDPFANNPRYNESFLSLFLKKQFERRFINFADKIITVNRFCGKLLSVKGKDKLFYIDNGYDDSLIHEELNSELSQLEETKLIYPGKFYLEPIALLNIIKNRPDLAFVHVGKKSEYNLTCLENKIFELGERNYRETISLINSSDIGIILTHGDAFESSTKIFDYIACNKKILLVTNGKPNTGNLSIILENYPNLAWCRNNEKEIELAINRLKRTKIIKVDPEQFSRKKSLEKLIKVIEG